MLTTRPVTKPAKQRKMLYKAPAHIRHKLFASHFSPELRGMHVVKNLPVRSGDTVRIMRGDHKGFEGKVTRIDRKKYRIYVEGLTREKVDGTTIFVPIHPSKVMITRLNLDDKWRKEILETKKARKKPKEVGKRPKPKPPKVAEAKEVVEEKAALEEKVAPEKKPAKKRITKKKGRVQKKVTERVKEKPEEATVEEKPKARKKRTGRKSAKKTEEGGE